MKKKKATIPNTDSIEELARFWDTHDATDFEDQLEVVTERVFELDPNRSAPPAKVARVRCTRTALRVDLHDGRSIIAPLAWYPRLSSATPKVRANWKVAGSGYRVRWPDLDEEISIAELLNGIHASEKKSLAS
jgi:Protein of unknown function (DUF2442)